MSSNATHRKRLARALAEQAGLTYQQARTRVETAATQGRLPRRLDNAGMAKAVQVLSEPAADFPGLARGDSNPPHGTEPETSTERMRRPRHASGNERARQAVEANVRAEERIAAWISASTGQDPHPVRWSWADPESRKDGWSEIEVEYSDGRRALTLPVDLPVVDTADDLDPSLAGALLVGGLDPYTGPVTDRRGRRVPPTCDVCDRRLRAGEPWWIVRQEGRDWENDMGVACRKHRPDLLPWRPGGEQNQGNVLAADDARRLRVEDLRQNLLVQTPSNEVLKLSEFYEDGRVSAQVLYPLQPRTTVRLYTQEQAAQWRLVSARLLAAYERAWGFRD